MYKLSLFLDPEIRTSNAFGKPLLQTPTLLAFHLGANFRRGVIRTLWHRDLTTFS
jgi:hypothetical protein